MTKLLRQTRSKPQRIHQGSIPRHLRKTNCTVVDLYRAYGLHAHANATNATEQTSSASVPTPNHYVTSQSFLHGSRLDPTKHKGEEGQELGKITYEDGTTCTVLEHVVTRRIGRVDEEFVVAAREKYGDDIDAIFLDLSLNQMQLSKVEIRRLFKRYDDVQRGGIVKHCTESVLKEISLSPKPPKHILEDTTTMTIDEARWVSRISQRLCQDV